jgi:FkbM family methyltransferase
VKLTDFGVAVVEGDLLSSRVEQAGTLACADGWLQAFKAYIPEGGTVCDIGAALGDHTASYAAMVGSTGRVYAFEPYGPFLQCLYHNTADMPNVIVSGYALADRESIGVMVRSEAQPNNLGMAHLETVSGHGEWVRVKTLDQMSESWDRLDFVKIDVEGMEPAVLDGAKATLTRFRPTLLIEVNTKALRLKGYSPADVYQRLRALGYTSFVPTRPGDTLASAEIDILCVPTPVKATTGLQRIHLLSVPNTQTTDAYPLDGFCVRTRYFAKLLMRLGHEVILYGVGENDTPCTSFVQVLSTDEQRSLIGDTPYQAVPFDAASPLFYAFNSRVAIALRTSKQPHDVIATIAGSAQALPSEQNPDLTLLEYSIGYSGVCAPYRVYQSQAWRHLVHGMSRVDGGRTFDSVIPPWFDVPAQETPEDYVVFCGRIVDVKGIKVACDAAERAGVKLVVMGHGDPSLITYGEYLGDVPTAERNRIYAKARALLAPTQFLEPFGNISAEAQLCGTPVISTDFGAFTESVEQGRTGFRCVTLGEFVQAIDMTKGLDRQYVRDRAIRLYGEDAAEQSYAAYFRRLALIHGEGAQSLAPTLPFQWAPEPALAFA